MLPAPKMPSPPAALTALANSQPLHHTMPAWMIGTSMPNKSQIRLLVFMPPRSRSSRVMSTRGAPTRAPTPSTTTCGATFQGRGLAGTTIPRGEGVPVHPAGVLQHLQALHARFAPRPQHPGPHGPRWRRSMGLSPRSQEPIPSSDPTSKGMGEEGNFSASGAANAAATTRWSRNGKRMSRPKAVAL